jgi:hypothetical protein
MRGHDPKRDPEQVRPKRARSIDLGPVPVQHHEYFVGQIFELTRGCAESP